MKKTVIITGGAGFLGSHLVPELVSRGFDTHVIDNLVSGKKENVPVGATLHIADVCDSKTIDSIFKKVGPVSFVFHLAALPRVQYSIDFPIKSNHTNIEGIVSVLNVAKDNKVKRFVYSASSSAYGDQTIMPLHEGLATNPKSPYALQKYVGELYCRMFNLIYGLETVSLRYFNLFGPNFDPNGPYAQAIGKFIDLRKKGKELTITGDGTQTRDCVHVRDVVRANILATESEKVGKGEVINIGSGKNYSVNKIAELIGGSVIHIAPRLEPHDTKADISLAKKLLDWVPEVSLEEGIKELKKLNGIK